MGFEVDVLEREENYKRRLNRLLTLIGIVAALAIGAGFYLNHRQNQELQKAEAAAEEMRLQAEIAAHRAAYSADSAAAYNRLADFMDTYKAEKAQGASLFLIKVPANRGVANFLQEVWDDYARAVDPDIQEWEKRDLFRLHYVDAMNLTWYNSRGEMVYQGEHRPHSILVPELKFKLTEVEIQRTTFPQVARAQMDAGFKIVEEGDDLEAVPAGTDSLEAGEEAADAEAAGIGETASAP